MATTEPTAGLSLEIADADPPARFEVDAAGLLIGRSDTAQIRLDDQLVSREHARISRASEDRLVIEDLGSTNGTAVNGATITGPRPLRPGDAVQVGGTILRVTGPGHADATAAAPAVTALPRAEGHGDATEEAPAGDASATLEEAKRLYAAGRLAGSAQAFGTLLGFPAFAAEGHYGLGLVRLHGGALDQAAAEFRRSLAADPGHANAHYQLGVVAERGGRPDDAVGHYREALGANGTHAGARRALARLDAAPGTTQLPQELADPSEGSIAQFGVYEYLRGDKSPLSKQALAVMETLGTDSRPFIGAYLGQIFIRIALFVAAAAIAAALTRIDRVDLPGSRVLVLDVPGWTPLAVLLVGAIPVLWRLLVIATMRIRIDKGRLQLERGILTRKITNLELWRVTDVDLEQGFWNRVTGDGTIVLTAYQEKKPIRVTGLARGEDLREAYQQILNLAFLLRSNPIVKGIIT